MKFDKITNTYIMTGEELAKAVLDFDSLRLGNRKLKAPHDDNLKYNQFDIKGEYKSGTVFYLKGWHNFTCKELYNDLKDTDGTFVQEATFTLKLC